MREELWRLYRHLIIGGVVIVISCYSVMEFTQARFGTSKAEQLLCVDAEVSSSLLLSGISSDVPESQFKWSSSLSTPLPLPEIVPLLDNKSWLRLSGDSYQLSIGSKPMLVGIAPEKDQMFKFEPLLERLLLTDKLSYQDKVFLIENMPCLSVQKVSSSVTAPLTGVALIHGSYHEYGFLWKDDSSQDVLSISILNEDSMSLSLIVVIVVSIGIVVMLLLIWREITLLDVKRKTFESMTRQIARGRSGGDLSKEIPDSSGTLKELAYSFDSMSSHIERLLKVQREMTNAISHELRTPIARLRFGLEVMKDEVDDSTASTIEALEGDVEELNTLVDEVLTYGKLEGGSMELNFSELSIYQLVHDILKHNHLLLQHLTVTVNINEADSVSADEHHLSRALQNLILNASKYASSNITISFSHDDDRLQLDVEDDGPGIAFEDRDKVFIPFQRLDNSRTRASGGYGLGLAIVQRIAFWHGGAVLIDASESGGAKFSFIWSRHQHQKTLS